MSYSEYRIIRSDTRKPPCNAPNGFCWQCGRDCPDPHLHVVFPEEGEPRIERAACSEACAIQLVHAYGALEAV